MRIVNRTSRNQVVDGLVIPPGGVVEDGLHVGGVAHGAEVQRNPDHAEGEKAQAPRRRGRPRKV